MSCLWLPLHFKEVNVKAGEAILALSQAIPVPLWRSQLLAQQASGTLADGTSCVFPGVQAGLCHTARCFHDADASSSAAPAVVAGEINDMLMT